MDVLGLWISRSEPPPASHPTLEVPKHTPGPDGLSNRPGSRGEPDLVMALATQAVTVMVAVPDAVTAVLPSLEDAEMVTV